MPDNPTVELVRDRTGFFRVVIEEVGGGSAFSDKPKRTIVMENLSYQEASELRSKIEKEVNAG